MDELIRFYLLGQPRSVSDMISALTEKQLSPDASERSEQIPRIAGNWFREDSGYLWRLQERGAITDRGRQYAIDRKSLVNELFSALQAQRCYLDREVRGEEARLNDAYSQLMPDITMGAFKQQLVEDVFSPENMKAMFSFDRWDDTLLDAETNQNTVASHRLRLGFWPSVHFMLLSAVLASRKRHVKERRRADTDQYFQWRHRQQSLEEAREALATAIARERYPSTRQTDDGRFTDDCPQQLVDGFTDGAAVLDPDAAEHLANLYLLSFNDGVELFNQYSHYDHDINLLFNLMERGWMVGQNSVERDEHTGNLVIPLGDVRSYLHDLRALFRTSTS